MTSKMPKFDMRILNTNSDRFKYIKPVTSMDTFQGMSRDFHEDGLFSTSIFGKVGSQDRNLRMSYINIKIDIFAPKIYMLICAYRQLYKNIMAGTVYAKWDNQLKDFVKSTNVDGHTGFSFFIQHWKELQFVKNDSHSQNEAVDTINRYRDIALTRKAMVIPAGLRDVEIADNEEISKHEINDLYVKLLTVANSLPDSGDLNSPLTDRARLSLQMTLCEIYQQLSQLTGLVKKSFIRRKFGSRRVKYGSRNVITPLATLPSHIDDPRVINFNETGIGLYQAISVYSPIMINKILNGYAAIYSNPNEGTLNLVNTKTLVREEVQVKSRAIDKFTTPTGLGKLIDGFSDKHLRNRPIMIDGYYLGLVYKTEKTFRLINDINDLSDKHGVDVANVRPITYGEFFYIHGYKWFRKFPGTVTRYPINGYRSIYVTYPHVITNGHDQSLIELDEDFQPTETYAYHYPNTSDDNWYDGMILHPSRLDGLGGDFDGDMCNFNPVFSNEAVAAIAQYLNSPSAYLNSSGQLLHNPFTEVLERVLYSLSGDPK